MAVVRCGKRSLEKPINFQNMACSERNEDEKLAPINGSQVPPRWTGVSAFSSVPDLILVGEQKWQSPNKED